MTFQKNLLLPQTVPNSLDTLKALFKQGTPNHAEPETVRIIARLAADLDGRIVQQASGTWSDAARMLAGLSGDLPPPFDSDSNSNIQTPNKDFSSLASPLHVVLGLTDLSPIDPAQLQLSEEESRALCASMSVQLSADGVRFEYVHPLAWRMLSQRPIDVLSNEPAFIVGENLRPYLPRGKDGRLVEMWMNELQMALHTHPINEAREAKGLPPINMLWLSNFGHGYEYAAQGQPYQCVAAFAKAMQVGDAAAWHAAWHSHADALQAAESLVLGDAHPRVILTKPSTAKRNLWSCFKKPLLLEPVLIRLLTSTT